MLHSYSTFSIGIVLWCSSIYFFGEANLLMQVEKGVSKNHPSNNAWLFFLSLKIRPWGRGICRRRSALGNMEMMMRVC